MTDVIKELEQHLLALSPTEKVQVMQLLAHSLGNSWQGFEKQLSTITASDLTNAWVYTESHLDEIEHSYGN